MHKIIWGAAFSCLVGCGGARAEAPPVQQAINIPNAQTGGGAIHAANTTGAGPVATGGNPVISPQTTANVSGTGGPTPTPTPR